MLVRCKLKRPAGTKIELFGREYHFKPQDKALKHGEEAYMEADHVAEVEDPNAIFRLCAQIKEGYEPVDPKDEIPRASKTITQHMAADKAAESEAKPVIIQDETGNEINLTALEPEDLRSVAREKFGIKVHAKWDDKAVIAKIIEKTRGEDE